VTTRISISPPVVVCLALVKYCILILGLAAFPLSSFGASLIVPDSPIGEAWFDGTVDTVSPGMEALLGFKFEVKVDYYLYSWDRVSLLYIADSGQPSGCDPSPFSYYSYIFYLHPQNCLTSWSGPVGPDIIGIALQDNQLAGIFDVNGSQAVSWSTTDDRWTGYWNNFNLPRTMSGPVTSFGLVATPEPQTSAMLLGGLFVCVWGIRVRLPVGRQNSLISSNQ
jgi:hypothetical protein